MEQSHRIHDHKLTLERKEEPYICGGCKEMGFGNRYSCKRCKFYLHEECMNPTSLPFYYLYKKDSTFKFYEHLQGKKSKGYCEACGEDILGFVYQCTKTGRCLHPDCRVLPKEIQAEGMNFNLCRKLSSNCRMCEMKELRQGFTGWSYSSACKKHHIHVSCVKKQLVKTWKEGCLSGKRIDNTQAFEKMVSNLQLDFPANSNTNRGKIIKFWGFIRRRKITYWGIAKYITIVIIATLRGDPTAVFHGL